MSLLIVNCCSQNGQAKKKWDRIHSRFKNHLIFEIHQPSDWSKLETWIISRFPQSQNKIIVAGGDGTVHSVIQIIMKHQLQVKLGLIGLGSSNDYHKPHHRNYQEWLEGVPTRLRFDAAKPHDLIHFSIEGSAPREQRWSALNGSVGITANGNAIFNQPSSMASRIKPYSVNAAITGAAIEAFIKTETISVSLDIDGKSAQKKVVNVGFFKRAHFAGSFHYDQSPLVDDGKVGIAVIDDCSKFAQLKVMSGLSKGKFKALRHCSLSFAKQIQLQSDHPFTIEIDGETLSGTSAHVRVANRALWMCP